MELKTIQYYYDNAKSLKPTLQLLNEIHRLFVHQTVFSSIDIMLGIKPTFDTAAAYQKVVVRGEGGTCRLINLAAKHLLELIGFKCECISSDVVSIHKIRVPKHSAVHMTMVVYLEDSQSNFIPYVFDPGFGNSHRVVLPLTGYVIQDVMTSHRVIYDQATKLFSVQEYWGEWLTQFTFNLNNVMDEDGFEQHTRFTYQDSHFYRNNLYVQQCGEEGAIRLYNDRLITLKSDGEDEEAFVIASGGVRRVLMERFKLPKSFVDSIISNTGQMTKISQDFLQKNWESTPLANLIVFNTVNATNEFVQDVIANKGMLV